MKPVDFGLSSTPKPMEEHDDHPLIPLDDLVVVGHYPNLREAHDHGLVILAMGEAYWVSVGGDGGEYHLHAEPHSAPGILHELQIYAGEQDDARRVRSRPEPVDAFHFSAGWEVLVLWVASLLVVFYQQMQDPSLTGRAASSSIGLIARHEWWRPFTALFLHSDAGHLAGNLVSGVVFGALVSRSLGPLRAWCLILACGTMGNILTSLLSYPEPFLSIGASTAVFGALGILTGLGFAISIRQQSGRSWVKVAAPVMAGLVLLGWLGGGTGSTNTDVLGHAFGFGSGLISGMIVGEMRQKSAKAPVLSLI
ncbi:MAG: rhomboid family intramembrane serine protease [Akkermansiaceae bacterium]